MIDPVIGESRHREQPGADIAKHLTRHGLRVNIVVHAREGETAAMALMRHAVESGAPCRYSGAASSHATTNTSMRCAMPGMRFPKTRMPASLWAHEHGQVLRHGTHAMQQVPAFRQR